MKELSDAARSLIELGSQHDGPSPADRARVRRALVSALGTSAVLASSTTAAGAAASAGVGAGGATVGSLLTWLAGGVGVGLLVALPAAMSAEPAEHPSRSTATNVAPPAPLPVAEPSSAPTPGATAAADTPPAVEQSPRAPERRPQRASTASAIPPAARAADELERESKLLSHAQRELAAGRPGTALAALDQHERTFPGGALTPEREAARVLGTCAAGQRDQARRLAEKFLEAHPSSPLRARVSASCR
ncbi:MAG: hypothetical protein KF718_28090 [Polyangiaceae bacterium]|nr:hypothetical protein [Polyangiaceae bacterium]